MGDDADQDDSADETIAGAVDDAMTDEVKRQKARFVQAIIGLDRVEGVGRRDEGWNDGFNQGHRD